MKFYTKIPKHSSSVSHTSSLTGEYQEYLKHGFIYVNCAYVDLLHYQPPCNNCLRSPYAVHGETTDDAWKPIGKWQNPYKRA